MKGIRYMVERNEGELGIEFRRGSANVKWQIGGVVAVSGY
jgi:hypothetical protein